MRLCALVLSAAACGGAPASGGSEPAAPADPAADLDLLPGTPEPLSRPAERAAPLPVPPPASAAPRPAARELRLSYRGRAIDLDVKDADLHNLFRLLADAGGVDIVVGDDVRGSVTLRLRGVPWDQVLHTVARMKGLRVERHGRLILVTAAAR